MWNPSGTYVHLPAADSVVTNLAEPEAPGQINVLSQDCFASPGAAITGLDGVSFGVGGTEDYVVSTIVVNPASAAPFSFTSRTPNIRIGNPAGSGAVDYGILMGVNLGTPQSDIIGFGMPGYESPSTGIVTIRAAFVGPDPVADIVLELSNFSTVVSTRTPLKTGAFYTEGFVSTVIMNGVSSINGINWDSISTAAGTV
jgi:hypothetical protein